MVQAKTAEEVRKYYNQRYRQEQLAAMRPQKAYRVFLRYLKLKRGKRLLDVGCGTGYFLKLASEAGVEAYGIDFSLEAVKIARKTAPRAKIFPDRAEKLRFKNKFFDYLVCLGSLQYFPQMEKALKEMIRVAKKEAVFCFLVPNANFLFWRLKGKDPRVLWGMEKNILNLKEWCDFWKKNGLVIETVYKDQWLGERIKLFEDKNLLKIGKRLLMKVGWWLLPLSWGYQFIFLCRLPDRV